MVKKKRNLFLYLTLACFIGLILIFIFDGYMGIYDTININTGEQEQKIEPDLWLRQDSYWSAGVDWGDKAFFRYEVDNRRFSTYNADIQVSVWQSQEKITDLLTEPISISSFDEEVVEWAIDTEELFPEAASGEQRYDYTVNINMGDLERRIVIYINYPAYPTKTVPIPPR